jgi:hypothetical protein
MGSGETTPTMTRVHRSMFERLAPGPVPAVVLDTPYGFQENSDDIGTRMVEYFRDSVGHPVGIATYRSRDVDPVTAATAVARIHEARYVMAGPGSPSYALRQWSGGPIPAALEEKLTRGGVLTMASAAALTLGVVTIPVYEIYKVGAEPTWLAGLDILGRTTGLNAAVVPHYDNAEGGNHDTRFCYIGERRLRVLEAALPEGAFVLGVDGHTALILDLESGSATVSGLGSVTVRANGRSVVFPTGTRTTIDALAASGREAAGGRSIDPASGWGGDPEPALAPDPVPSRSDGGSQPVDRAASLRAGPIGEAMAEHEGSFVAALTARDVRAAVGILLELDLAIETRLRAGDHGADLDAAAATFRSLLVRLGEAAMSGARDPRETLDPFVGTLLELRDRARDARDWPAADLIRERLEEAGVEVRDGSEGPSWLLRDPAARG